MDEKMLLLGMYLVFGALLIGLSFPLMLNKIKPNGLYGFRIPKTLNDPDTWYAVNHHFSFRLFWLGVACVLTSLILYGIPGLSVDAYALSVLGVFALGFLIGILQTVRYMRTL
jgi:uncharacterized membrane protein